MATIIGTSVGNNAIGATTYAPMKLPKTKANISIATTYQVRPKPAKGKYFTPNYWVELSLENLLIGTDDYLTKALSLLIKKNQ